MSAIPGVETPVLDKVHAPAECDGKIVTHSQMIGQFLDWLRDSKHIHLAVWLDTKEVPVMREDLPKNEQGEPPEGVKRFSPEWDAWKWEVVRYDIEDRIEPILVPASKGFSALLHDYFDIDPNAIENERRAMLAMLATLREGNTSAS